MNALRPKEIFFLSLLSVIILLSVIDIVMDYFDGASNSHMLLEFIVVIFSFFGVAYLINEIRERWNDLDALQEQLGVIHEDLSKSKQQLKNVGSQFGEIINEQFSKWDLSPSEREVAMLLLKGLSFEEITKIRGTKEKTIHQQATSIYKKSNVNGRHEFAAYFYEDFLVLEVA